MYPKNNASPPTVAVGSIYLIADGTLQTSDASVRVRTAGGAWGAGGGTLAYDVTSGAIEYTPTQAETNGEWFMVAVYKASCTTATTTVVTTAESTAGKVSLGAAQTTNITGTISGNSTHDAAAVLEALGDGSWATEAGGTGDQFSAIPDMATESKQDIIDALLDKMAVPIIGTSSGAGTGTEIFVYGGVTLTATIVGNNRTGVVFS